MGHKVLIVEDEKSIRRYLILSLKASGYNVLEAETGEEAVRLAEWERPDIALIDIGLPGANGIEVCQKLRAMDEKMGLIMLTARSMLKDKEEGFYAGADDYCVKPCDIKELQMRMTAVLRRLGKLENPRREHDIVSGDFKLDLDKHLFYKNEELVNLSPTEFALLRLLMENPNQAFDRGELLDRIWGINYLGDQKVVDVFIRRIRVKIADNMGNSPIATVWGKGYRWQL